MYVNFDYIKVIYYLILGHPSVAEFQGLLCQDVMHNNNNINVNNCDMY